MVNEETDAEDAADPDKVEEVTKRSADTNSAGVAILAPRPQGRVASAMNVKPIDLAAVRDVDELITMGTPRLKAALKYGLKLQSILMWFSLLLCSNALAIHKISSVPTL